MMMCRYDPIETLARGKVGRLLVGVVFLLFLGIGGGEDLFSEETPNEHPPQDLALDPLPGVPDGENGEQERFESLPDLDARSPRFQYKSGAMRDPFLSFVNPGEQDLRGVPPLQRVAVSELKLIGVARSGGRIGAMLQTPDGKSYPVRRGTRVGNNRGRVGHVGEESITIEEPYLNIFGRTALRQVVMKLYTKKEE